MANPVRYRSLAKWSYCMKACFTSRTLSLRPTAARSRSEKTQWRATSGWSEIFIDP